jgi:hypothetical protein
MLTDPEHFELKPEERFSAAELAEVAKHYLEQ